MTEQALVERGLLQGLKPGAARARARASIAWFAGRAAPPRGMHPSELTLPPFDAVELELKALWPDPA